MGSSRVGSNPTRSVIFITDFLLVVQQEPYLLCHISLAAMAEWLRRLTRNQMGSSRVGSNPTRSGHFPVYVKKCNKASLLSVQILHGAVIF